MKDPPKVYATSLLHHFPCHDGKQLKTDWTSISTGKLFRSTFIYEMKSLLDNTLLSPTIKISRV